MIELCDGTPIEDDKIYKRHLDNNLVVHNFRMLYENGQISEKQMLYGLVNALAHRNEQLEREVINLIESLPPQQLEVSFDD